MQTLLQPFPMLPQRSAQVWHHHPSFRRPAHFHAEPELNVVTRGTGVLAVGREHIEVRAGDVVLLQPGQDHALLLESPDFELFVMALKPQLADRCKLSLATQLSSITVPQREVRALRAAWLALSKLDDATCVENNLCEHFLDLARRFDTASAVCRRTLQTLRAAPETSETELACLLNVQPSEVSRAVRRGLGMRLVEFRTRLRLLCFVQCVDAGASLTRAAFTSGFGSYSQLHRAFRKLLGCAPADYFSGQRHQLDALLQQDLGRAPLEVAATCPVTG